jgi:hypothetical protein
MHPERGRFEVPTLTSRWGFLLPVRRCEGGATVGFASGGGVSATSGWGANSGSGIASGWSMTLAGAVAMLLICGAGAIGAAAVIGNAAVLAGNGVSPVTTAAGSA